MMIEIVNFIKIVSSKPFKFFYFPFPIDKSSATYTYIPSSGFFTLDFQNEYLKSPNLIKLPRKSFDLSEEYTEKQIRKYLRQMETLLYLLILLDYTKGPFLKKQVHDIQLDGIHIVHP